MCSLCVVDESEFNKNIAVFRNFISKTWKSLNKVIASVGHEKLSVIQVRPLSLPAEQMQCKQIANDLENSFFIAGIQ